MTDDNEFKTGIEAFYGRYRQIFKRATRAHSKGEHRK